MKNSKGFSLIEILTVIIILAVLLTIAVPSITKYILGSRDETFKAHEGTMSVAAEDKMVECISDGDCDVPGENQKEVVTLEELIEDGYLEELVDPDDKESYCDAERSHVVIRNVGKDSDLEYTSCLYCSNYETDNAECRIPDGGEGVPPICGIVKVDGREITDADDIEWVGRNRSVSVSCLPGDSQNSSVCDMPSFSRTFSATTISGSVVIKSKGGKETTCDVPVKVDKTVPTCSVEVVSGTEIGETGWYTGEVKVQIKNAVDSDSGVAETGVGTSRENPVYGSTTYTVNDGVTTVFGYVKDVAGNVGKCSIEVKVDNTDPEDQILLGYEAYPGNGDYTTSGVTITDGTAEMTAVGGNINFHSLSEHKGVEKVVVFFKEAVSTGTKMYVEYSSNGSSYTKSKIVPVIKGSTKAEIRIPAGTYENIRVILGDRVGITTEIEKISLFIEKSKIDSDNGSDKLYTNKDVIINIDSLDVPSGGYKYSFDGGSTWVDSEYKTYTTNQTVKVQSMDHGLNESEITTVVINNIDKLAPSCTLGLTGTMGEDDWYVGDVVVGFTKNVDAEATTSYGKSGVRDYGLDSYTGNKTHTHTEDIASTTYTGEIKDRAGNKSTCEITFKKDATKPECELTLSGTEGDNSWYKGDVVVSFKTTTDNVSGVENYGIGSVSGNKTTTHTANTASVEYIGHIKDDAGNTNTCDISFKKDSTAPTCKYSGGNSSWKSASVSSKISCEDNLSGCTSSSERTFTDSDKKTEYHSLTIKDEAGNSTSCGKTFDIYSDVSKPSCSIEYSTTAWTNKDIGVKFTFGDTVSGVNYYTITASDGFYIKSETWNNHLSYDEKIWSENTTQPYDFTVYDNAGNTKVCVLQISNIDKTAPTCSINKTTINDPDGVDATVTCSDDASGIATCIDGSSNTTVTYTNQKEVIVTTIKDKAGNSNVCSLAVNSKGQKRTCDTCKRCSSAGCAERESCSDESCGCNYTYEGQCTCIYAAAVLHTANCSEYIYERYNCTDYCKAQTSYWSGGGTCTRICASYKSCQNSNCDCATYNRSCSKCGCSSWNSWADASSCSASTNSTECQTVYY